MAGRMPLSWRGDQLKILGKLLEVGGGFQKSPAHTATFEIRSVEDIRVLGGYLYQDLQISTEIEEPKRLPSIQDTLREMSRLAQLFCAQTGDRSMWIQVEDMLKEQEMSEK